MAVLGGRPCENAQDFHEVVGVQVPHLRHTRSVTPGAMARSGRSSGRDFTQAPKRARGGSSGQGVCKAEIEERPSADLMMASFSTSAQTIMAFSGAWQTASMRWPSGSWTKAA